jgi:methylenetetrahydrofolate dehydrogenase (NADP+)/methenyltetrahydrofolate cyclohydrolase
LSAQVIDGKAVAQTVKDRVRGEVATLVAEGIQPGLATIIVGDDPASHVYVRNKRQASAEVGIESFHTELPADASTEQVAELITALNAQDRVNGILLQLPVPDQVDGDAMTALIDPLKDVDGLTPVNAGLLVQGRDALVPCTPAGVMELLDSVGAELRGVEAVVVGRSKLVGRPLASLLLARDATVTTCHSRTRDLGEVCRRADVLVAAVGVPRLVKGDMVREDAIVIDVGINRTDDGLVGDVDFESAAERASAITPVPGGVGPMTIAMLLANTVKATRLQLAR